MNRAFILPIVVLAPLFVAVAACSSSGSEVNNTPTDAAGDTGTAAQDTGSPPEDTGASSDTAIGPNDATAGCTTLVNSAGSIPINQVASNPPPANGGPMANGTYYETDATIYTGAGGPTGINGSTKTTIRITGTTIEVATGFAPQLSTVSITITDSTFHAVDTCPDTASFDGSFTAGSDSLIVELPQVKADGTKTTLVETFTKQP